MLRTCGFVNLFPKLCDKSGHRERVVFMKSRGYLVAFVVMLASVLQAEMTLSDVKVVPIPPWGMSVNYAISGIEEGGRCEVYLAADLGGSGSSTYDQSKFVGFEQFVGNGTYQACLNLAKEGVSTSEQSGDVFVAIKRTYCEIDLSSGPTATRYPVSYLGKEPKGGFNVAAYKSSKLVLKSIIGKPLYMGIFEVTQKQWALVMGTSPSKFSEDYLPVENVSWEEAVQFCNNIKERTGLNVVLPSIEDWEYVCRAGTTTRWSYGDHVNGSYMWYCDNSSSSTHEVGTKLPNPWGFYDMHGNVLEFSSFVGGYDDDLCEACGGSWGDNEYCCQSTHQCNQVFTRTTRGPRIGFRAALALSKDVE